MINFTLKNRFHFVELIFRFSHNIYYVNIFLGLCLNCEKPDNYEISQIYIDVKRVALIQMQK